MKTGTRAAVCAGLLLLLVAAVLAGLGIGTARIDLSALLRSGGLDDYQRSIFFSLRLPRVAAALLAGGGLAVSGVLLQGLFRNPLVEPYTLGVSGGAALGVALAVLLPGGAAWRPWLAFGGAVVSVALVLAFSRRRHEFGVATTLLTGVMLSFVSSSLLMLIMALVRAEQLQGIIFWMMGSVGLSDPGLLRWSAPVFLAGVLWAWWLAFPLNGLALGESAAHHLGLRVDRVQRSVFLAASLLTGLSVAISGIIGFVGLLVPHLLRPLLGSDHRWLIPASFMAGAAFLVGADLLSRTIISPLELPVGVITGLLGGSIFISSLYRRERHP